MKGKGIALVVIGVLFMLVTGFKLIKMAKIQGTIPGAKIELRELAMQWTDEIEEFRVRKLSYTKVSKNVYRLSWFEPDKKVKRNWDNVSLKEFGRIRTSGATQVKVAYLGNRAYLVRGQEGVFTDVIFLLLELTAIGVGVFFLIKARQEGRPSFPAARR